MITFPAWLWLSLVVLWSLPAAVLLVTTQSGRSWKGDRWVVGGHYLLAALLMAYIMLVADSCACSLILLVQTIFGPTYAMIMIGRPYHDSPHERIKRVGTCWSCGYNLTGATSGRCPECGSSIPVSRSPNPDVEEEP